MSSRRCKAEEEVDKVRCTLEETQLQLSNELSKLSIIFSRSPTPRQLLSMKLIVSTLPRIEQIPIPCSRFLETGRAQDLTANDLDTPISGASVVDSCDTPLEIDSVETLTEVLRDFSETDVALLSGMYRRALVFREALARVRPRPELEAISTSIALDRQLTAFGICNDELNSTTAKYNVEAGEILVGSIDRGNLKVPIFTKFFRRLRNTG